MEKLSLQMTMHGATLQICCFWSRLLELASLIQIHLLIAIGNAWIDDETSQKGLFDYWWTHSILSDATHDAIFKCCNFSSESSSAMYDNITNKALDEIGNIDIYNMYAPICLTPDSRNVSATTGSINMVKL